MFEHHLFYELLYRHGGGYRCPRCYSFHGYADGFGMSRCQNCGSYFSVLQNNRPVGTTLKELFKTFFGWLKEMTRKIRGKRCEDPT